MMGETNKTLPTVRCPTGMTLRSDTYAEYNVRLAQWNHDQAEAKEDPALKGQHFQEAVRLYSETMKTRPSAELALNLGDALMSLAEITPSPTERLQLFSTCAEAYGHALKEDPSNPDILEKLGGTFSAAALVDEHETPSAADATRSGSLLKQGVTYYLE